VSIERRLTKLEARIISRCPQCQRELHCDACTYGVDVRTASNEELERIVLDGVRKKLQQHDINFFRLIGCNLSTLTVDELRMLKVLLQRMGPDGPHGGPHATIHSTD
jgi:hypothetical protein